MKNITYLGTYSILRITKTHFSKNAPKFLSLWNSLDDWYNMYDEDPWKEISVDDPKTVISFLDIWELGPSEF